MLREGVEAERGRGSVGVSEGEGEGAEGATSVSRRIVSTGVGCVQQERNMKFLELLGYLELAAPMLHTACWQ
jgi:hypothetical protein